ncbi:MAG: hypothetical protein ACKVIF_08530, partial [Rhodospirillales bacterium]
MASTNSNKQNQNPSNVVEDDVHSVLDKLWSLPNEKQESDRAEAEDDSLFSSWTAPFYLRYRLLSIAGVMLTLGWLGPVIFYIDQYMGWENLLHLQPYELAAMAAGVTTPIALLWMVVALFERGREMRHESEALRWYLRRLIYPTDKSESRIREITESLRRQSRDLSKASDEAAERAKGIYESVREQIAGLSKVSEDADLRAQAVAETLKRQTEELNEVSEKATVRARDVGE